MAEPQKRENLLELFCAPENVDNPQPEDIENYGAGTDESFFADDYAVVNKD